MNFETIIDYDTASINEWILYEADTVHPLDVYW